MRQFDIDLDRAMALCEEFYGDYTSFSRIYTFTNENISEYHQIDNVDKCLFENRTDTDLVFIYRKKEK